MREQLAEGDTLSGPALSFYLTTGLSRDRQLGLGSGVILRTGDREDRMLRKEMTMSPSGYSLRLPSLPRSLTSPY